MPFKKIKQPVLPEKQVEQTVVEKKTEDKPKPEIEKPKVNETKIAVVEKKNPAQDSNQKNKDIDLVKSESGDNLNKNDLSNDQDSGPADSESITSPAIFPGCEKAKNKKEILDCFNKKITSEVQFYLDNSEWKKDSKETVYFEIDKQGNITNIKFDSGNKINDKLAVETLNKIALDFNRRTNPNRRIKPGKDALGKVVTIRYKIPVSLVNQNFD